MICTCLETETSSAENFARPFKKKVRQVFPFKWLKFTHHWKLMCYLAYSKMWLWNHFFIFLKFLLLFFTSLPFLGIMELEEGEEFLPKVKDHKRLEMHPVSCSTVMCRMLLALLFFSHSVFALLRCLYAAHRKFKFRKQLSHNKQCCSFLLPLISSVSIHTGFGAFNFYSLSGTKKLNLSFCSGLPDLTILLKIFMTFDFFFSFPLKT